MVTDRQLSTGWIITLFISVLFLFFEGISLSGDVAYIKTRQDALEKAQHDIFTAQYKAGKQMELEHKIRVLNDKIESLEKKLAKSQ